MTDIVLQTGTPPRPRQAPHAQRPHVLAGKLAAALLVAGLVVAGWQVRTGAPYAANSDFAYALGLSGGLLMLALLLYPLRKRVRALHVLGALRRWFAFHMLAGILGPTLVLFHSTFHVHSLNAGVALASMLLVAASGLVGRFLYRRIHRGLYGSRATHAQLQQALDQRLREMHDALRAAPAASRDRVLDEIERFARLVTAVPPSRLGRAAHFVSLGARRLFAGLRARRALRRQLARPDVAAPLRDADLTALLDNIDETLRSAQKAAQLSTYERLFSLWHAVHIPFLCLLVVTAAVHVVAVHAY